MQNALIVRQKSLAWERGNYELYSIQGDFQVHSVIEVDRPPALLDLGKARPNDCNIIYACKSRFFLGCKE
jgi:hypothetical protein